MDALKRAINKLCGYGVGESAEAFERWFAGEQRRNVHGVSEPLARVAHALSSVETALRSLADKTEPLEKCEVQEGD